MCNITNNVSWVYNENIWYTYYKCIIEAERKSISMEFNKFKMLLYLWLHKDIADLKKCNAWEQVVRKKNNRVVDNVVVDTKRVVHAI